MADSLRIILPSIRADDHALIVTGENLRYLKNVHRCSINDDVIVLNGKGMGVKTKIRKIGKDAVVLAVLGTYRENTESSLNLALIQGILKGHKMDFVIQKVTELGIKEIFPVITARTQSRFTRRLPHWKRVAEEATKQSKRYCVPIIHAVHELDEIYDQINMDAHKVVFHEYAGTSISAIVTAKKCPVVYYMIGPEGGLTSAEVSHAEKRGFLKAGLGKRILKSETASLVGATLLQHFLGDLQEPYIASNEE